MQIVSYILWISLAVLACFNVHAGELDLEGVRQAALSDHDAPGGDWSGIPISEPKVIPPEPQWIMRTGFKKGVYGSGLREEAYHGPDVAVLKSGFFEYWPALLSELKEPFVMIEPNDAAALGKNKKLLIIPSAGLSGLADSAFFSAGLSAFLRSGGVILCLAQQDGNELSALPRPGGAMLYGRGWSKDAGPLFRASFVQAEHPALLGLERTTPNIETDGFIEHYPQDSIILLSRPDGYPTALMYRFENGWVVATTMLSDVIHGRFGLTMEEKALLRSIVSWTKAGANMKSASPGDDIEIPVAISGPQHGDAHAAKIMIIGPDADRVNHEETLKIFLTARSRTEVRIVYKAPQDAWAGIYHIEYLLLDKAGKAVSPRVESETGWFAIGRPASGARIKSGQRPLSAFSGVVKVSAAAHQTGRALRAMLRLSPEDVPAGSAHFIVTAEGKEKFVDLSKGPADIVFEFPEAMGRKFIRYAVYHSSGRLITRGSCRLGHIQRGVGAERPIYKAGETARVVAHGMESGELTLTGLGLVASQIVSAGGYVELPIPPGLPSGEYTLKWEFRRMDDSLEKGEFTISIEGIQARAVSTSLSMKPETRTYNMDFAMSLESSAKTDAEVILLIKDSGEGLSQVARRTVLLDAGVQEVRLPFRFKPSQAGMYELIYGILLNRQEGAGVKEGPILVSAGRRLFDAGDTAILGLATDKPVYYESSGNVGVTGIAFGTGPTRIELYQNGKKIYKEKVLVSGITFFTASISTPSQGFQTIRAAATGRPLESSRVLSFTYGTDLPDLSASIGIPEINRLEIPVAIIVENKGRISSAPARAALYEGAVSSSNLIGIYDLPTIEPGSRHIASILWRVSGKAGTRALTAMIDPDSTLAETDKRNNITSITAALPDAVMSLSLSKESYETVEPISISITVSNLSKEPLRTIGLVIQIMDPRGIVEKAEHLQIPEISAGKEIKIDRSILMPSARPGRYEIAVDLASKRHLSSAAAWMNIIPTIFLSGDMEGTARTAGLCRPFTVKYNIKNTGNIPATAGAARIELRSEDSHKPVFSLPLPFIEGGKEAVLDSITAPAGRYYLSLRAEAANKEHNIKKDFVIAEQPLMLTAPVEVHPHNEPVPRVLVWTNSSALPVQAALIDTMLKEAFDGQAVYYKKVGSREEFEANAMTGVFNTYLLLEQEAMPSASDQIKEQIDRGRGLIIIGEGDRAAAVSSEFGFRFGSLLPEQTRLLSFTPEFGTVLSGTIPISGRFAPVEKRGARTLAELNGSKPAVISADFGKGKVVVMPFSIFQSAIDSGTILSYGLLLRAASLYAAPRYEDPQAAFSNGFTISSLEGPVKTRVVDTLPPDAKILWNPAAGVIKDNTIIFEFSADRTPRSYAYLYQSSDKSARTDREVFYECGGKYVGMKN